jgi:hypothetical protein
MRILTTSDLSYVSGGDSWGGTPEGQASYSGNTGDSDGGEAAAFASGIAYTLDNPYAAAAAYLYQLYQNSQNYQTVPYSNPMGDADGGY